MLETVKSGIQGSLLNLQSVPGDLLDTEQDAISVQRPE